MRGFFNWVIHIQGKTRPLFFQMIVISDLVGVRPMQKYQNGAKVSQFQGKLTNIVKTNFWKKISDSEIQEIHFRGPAAQDEIFKKNRKISQISSGRSDKLRKPPQTYFLVFRRSLRSKWVIYQPRATIFEDFLILWRWGIFWLISRKSHFGRFAKSWHLRGKPITFEKIMFFRIFFLEMFSLVP